MSDNGRIAAAFGRNPAAWIFAGLSAFSLFAHYRTGEDFTAVCKTVVMLEEGYFDIESSQDFEATGLGLDGLMISLDEHEELFKSQTPEGRAYRWWRKHSRSLREACGNRLAEQADYGDY